MNVVGRKRRFGNRKVRNSAMMGRGRKSLRKGGLSAGWLEVELGV
jgi:hypothetical protein